MKGPRSALVLAAVVAALPALAEEAEATVDVGEEVEITSGAVTALSCAVQARDEGRLELLTSCPLSEVAKGLVVFDVAEKQIYRISTKAVFRYELEKAYGGGSIDFSGKVAKVEKAIATVDVEEYSVTAKPKAGSFKGCL
jgi:hypothetical protein